MINWHTDDYNTYYAETDDPRLLLVIQRDEDPQGPDGDAYAPAYWTDEPGTAAGHTFSDDEVAAAYADAREYFSQDRDKVARYLRIFHDSVAVEVWSRVHRHGYGVVLFDTPAFRAHCGIPDTMPADDVLAGDVADWQAYLDGDVYGIGYAINEDRTANSVEVDLGAFDVELTCWGFYGEEYAKLEAIENQPRQGEVLSQDFLF